MYEKRNCRGTQRAESSVAALLLHESYPKEDILGTSHQLQVCCTHNYSRRSISSALFPGVHAQLLLLAIQKAVLQATKAGRGGLGMRLVLATVANYCTDLVLNWIC